MSNSRHHFYFIIAIVAILATGGFVMLEVSDTMTDIALVESSFYSVVRNGDARLSAEISGLMNGIDLDFLDSAFEAVDEEINNL